MTAQSSSSLFRPLAPAGASVDIRFNDTRLCVPAGVTVAAALLAAGVSRFRATPVSGAPRAPYCMMGACFDCLVEIDGVPARQSCMVEVRDGMQVRSQEGARDLPPATMPAAPSLENADGR
ncbi:TPA: (2Fe-2S)-binding protein [Burkholderia aenigmatica]|uniref:(2Fe-2S)-binding protein n=1 Tax=Burkholderia sp. AU45251 TaxID=3059204 RepID=UPI0026545752|nr:(2Fe-2S)-binding protein [Burkholderia sp. AU45251]HDR9482434.1 (2Fe-2S)-binding protein [Burkholderia aenigmatica]MDN7514928.1 (2Fe-2S)-binding protein [Burkholderia sp. AU45251]HDR9514740.1 (2Fe-2S)-binding protein [Burkholderia aenigmatica]HDR9590805.1 (2Fe-2S)-binding protein [Burkholderia aenigmatica]HDR9599961.1 (2Fe-2S)-binding protein [Burkholderia aenigmatica]